MLWHTRWAVREVNTMVLTVLETFEPPHETLLYSLIRIGTLALYAI